MGKKIQIVYEHKKNKKNSPLSRKAMIFIKEVNFMIGRDGWGG